MPKAAGSERDPLTNSILGAAIEVHRHLGPGLLESIYDACLAWELRARDIRIERQVPVPVMYKGLQVPLAYRLDLVVEKSAIMEVQSVDRLHPLVDGHVLTHLRVVGRRPARILNFHVGLLRVGGRSLVLLK